MSCWMKYNCEALKDVDKKIIKDTFKELGFSLDEEVKSVATSYYGGTESNFSTCDAALVDSKGNVLQVGVTYANEDGNLEIQGDFWMTGIDHQSLIQKLAQTYQKNYLTEQLELNGYTIESVEVNQQGEVEIEAYAWSA